MIFIPLNWCVGGENKLGIFYQFFAMAQIRRIGHDHHTPFWGVVVVVLLLGYQAVTRGENKLPHGQYTLDPQYFYIL